MKDTIKIENGMVIKLPTGMSSELKTDMIGYNVYFEGFHTYIPENASQKLAEEKLKDLAFSFFKDVKKTIEFLT